MKKLLIFGIPVVLAAAVILFGAHYAQSFGAGGHMWHHDGGSMGGGDYLSYRIDKMTKDLNLNAAQQAKIDSFKQQMQSNMGSGWESRKSMHEAIKAELAKPTPDFALIAPLIDQQIDQKAQNAHALVAQFGEFYQTLSADQKKTLATEFADHFNSEHQFKGQSQQPQE